MSGEAADGRFVMACRTPWLWDLWDEADMPGEWRTATGPDELTLDLLEEFNPDRLFFPHWSHIVPAEIHDRWECIGYHAAPLPYGRGGTPVQNMIVRGHERTELVAFRMVEELDAGPVYLRRSLSLLGGGDEIYYRIAHLSLEMTREIIETDPEPEEQEGEPTVFGRRSPAESRVPEDGSLEDLYDFIRMLDAEGYPGAFLEHGDFRIEFSRAALRRGRIEADVTIERTNPSEDG